MEKQQRLIDADALVCKLVSVKKDYAKERNALLEMAVNCLIKILQKETICPTIDAVHVVRCKDCEHYGWEQEYCHGKTQRFCKLHKGLVFVDKDSFCSYGKRRCDNGTEKERAKNLL